jgi:hypothetical protein
MQAAKAAYEASKSLDDIAKELTITFESLANSGDAAS